MPSEAVDSNTTPVVEIKRLDPDVANRTSDYPGLAKGTNVLVTTGGVVSVAAVSLLKSAGCEVTVLGAATAPDCILVEGSAMNPEACAKAVAGQDVVVHAGRPCPGAAAGAVAEGTRNLLEAAAAAGVKAFVFRSSARYLSLVFVCACTLAEDVRVHVTNDPNYTTACFIFMSSCAVRAMYMHGTVYPFTPDYLMGHRL